MEGAVPVDQDMTRTSHVEVRAALKGGCTRKSGVAEKYNRCMYVGSITGVNSSTSEQGVTEGFQVEVGLYQGLALSH